MELSKSKYHSRLCQSLRSRYVNESEFEVVMRSVPLRMDLDSRSSLVLQETKKQKKKKRQPRQCQCRRESFRERLISFVITAYIMLDLVRTSSCL
ncbi:hypothetical protein CEXT_436351 [Caerostris extrusa]|uniref:Uncharacterized protein n=1 Tax=Caerostris extrusa TaxID=172846 RepID=A0AAV4XS86_CAEEX|nr:hypothetical protein CEXT_436351 [Caerostris extrusa]